MKTALFLTSILFSTSLLAADQKFWIDCGSIGTGESHNVIIEGNIIDGALDKEDKVCISKVDKDPNSQTGRIPVNNVGYELEKIVLGEQTPQYDEAVFLVKYHAFGLDENGQDAGDWAKHFPREKSWSICHQRGPLSEHQKNCKHD